MTYLTCKGECSRQSFKDQFVATKSDYPESYYAYGCGRCSTCEKFFVPGIRKCPCCKGKIKLRPLLTKDRIKYVEQQYVRY